MFSAAVVAQLAAELPPNGNLGFWLCVGGAVVAFLSAAVIVASYLMHARERQMWGVARDPLASDD